MKAIYDSILVCHRPKEVMLICYSKYFLNTEKPVNFVCHCQKMSTPQYWAIIISIHILKYDQKWLILILPFSIQEMFPQAEE